MVGTGWVLAATAGPAVAGPAILLSWWIGALVAFVLSLVFAELGTRLPTAGGSARYPHGAFGRTAGFVSGWIYWVGGVAVVPLEVIAATQAVGTFVPVALVSGSQPVLTGWGFVVAAVMLAVLAVINGAGVRRLAAVNALATVSKIAIPFAAFVLLALVASRPGAISLGNLLPAHGLSDLRSVLPVVASGGIIFAFLGFEQAVQFGTESRTPDPDIGWAVKRSIWLVFACYLVFQVVFIAAGITNGNSPGQSPFTTVANQAGKAGLWLPFVVLLKLTGVISPASTGLLYVGSSARLVYGAAKNDGIPGWFAELNHQRVPLMAILIAFGIGLLFLIPSPTWQTLLRFNSSATMLSFALQPMALGALRRSGVGGWVAGPQGWRDWRGWAGLDGLPLLSFIVANWIVLFGTWEVNQVLLLVVLPLGMVIFFIHYRTTPEERRPSLDLAGAYWVPFYLGGLGVVSWLSSFQRTGDHSGGPLPFGVDLLVMALVSVVVYVGAIALCRKPGASMRQWMRAIDDEEST